MSKNTKIEWANHTFNPWWGCTKVSPACKNCYAEGFAKRTGHAVWGTEAPRRVLSEAHWKEPLRWNAEAAAAGRKDTVFCGSMCDILEDHSPTAPEAYTPNLNELRLRVFDLARETPNLIWLFLTKRPENYDLFPHRWLRGEWPSNAWFGFTAENQEWFDKRWTHAAKVPAPVIFCSYEPALGRLDIGSAICGDRRLGWLICGGESGPGARPIHPDWVRSVLDQCRQAGVSFFFKQWGEYHEARAITNEDQTGGVFEMPSYCGKKWGQLIRLDRSGRDVQDTSGLWSESDTYMIRVGKKAAGRLLDGREWSEMPEVLR